MRVKLDEVGRLQRAIAGAKQVIRCCQRRLTEIKKRKLSSPISVADFKKAMIGGEPPRQRQIHKLSPEGRERIIAAQRARWDKAKKPPDQSVAS